MATKSYSNIDKPVQLVEIVKDNGNGTGSTGPVTVASAGINPIAPAQQIVEPTAPTALSVPANARIAIIQNTGTSAARWRDDSGTLNTAAPFTGQRITADALVYDVQDLTKFRVVREAAGVTLEVFYYG